VELHSLPKSIFSEGDKEELLDCHKSEVQNCTYLALISLLIQVTYGTGPK